MLAMSRGCSEQLPAEDAPQMDKDAPDRQSASAANADSTAPGARSAPSAEGTLGQQRADREKGQHEELPSAAMHFEGCLGDALCVHLDFISILPQAVPLQQVTLVIAIMQVGAHPLQCTNTTHSQTAAQVEQRFIVTGHLTGHKYAGRFEGPHQEGRQDQN